MNDFIEIDYLEVGEKGSGDAITIRHQLNGISTIYVVDGGYQDDGQKIVDHIRKYYGRDSIIDHVVLTHPNNDHASGLVMVFNELPVKNLWMNRPWKHVDQLMPIFKNYQNRDRLIARLKSDDPKVAELEKLADYRRTNIHGAFQGCNIGMFTVLSPSIDTYLDLIVQSEKTPKPAQQDTVKYATSTSTAKWDEEILKGDSEGNETSIVQFAEICGKKILLTGDAGVRALTEAYDVASSIGLSVHSPDWFQVPHHGSRRNVSTEVLNKWLGNILPLQQVISRESAIISANQNDEEHPKKAVIRAMIHRGREVFQTKGTFWTHTDDAPKRDDFSPATPMSYPKEQEE